MVFSRSTADDRSYFYETLRLTQSSCVQLLLVHFLHVLTKPKIDEAMLDDDTHDAEDDDLGLADVFPVCAFTS